MTTADERAERDARLAELDFGPVVTIHGASVFGGFGAEHEHTTCLLCGAMVQLGDHQEAEVGGERVQIERNIRLHREFHAALDAPGGQS